MPSTPLIASTFPQRKGEVWQAGWFETPFWIRRAEGQASKPWLPLWVSTLDRFAKPGELHDTRGPDEEILVLFDDTLKDRQHRPERIEVSDDGLEKLLRERLGNADIEISRRDKLDRVDDLLLEMASAFGVPVFQGALEVKGVTVDAMRRYAQAARAFYESAPWRHLSDRDLVEIRGGAPPGFHYATVLGMGQTARGLGFFDDKTTFWRVASGDEVAGWRSAQRLWSLIYGSIAELPTSDASLWVEHGLEVAGPNAYPLAMNVQSADRVKRPSPKVLAFLTGLLAALAETTVDELDRGRWTRVIETPEGVKREYDFTLPLLLEPPTPAELARWDILPDRRAFERAHFVLHKKLQEHAPASPTELNEMLQHELSGPIDDIVFDPEDDRERAQEICFAAFDAWGRRRTRLIDEALALDSGCVDALVLKAEHTPELEEQVKLYQRAVAAGEESLENSIDGADGDLWAHYPTRPYLRALHGLGHSLEALGDVREAIRCFRRLLLLDEVDHQAVRFCLLTDLFEAGQYRDAENHIKAWGTSEESVWRYAKALAVFGRYGDGKRSRKALGRAFEENPLAAGALLDLELPPGADEVEDALDCSGRLLPTWDLTPGAFDWLQDQFDAYMRSSKGSS